MYILLYLVHISMLLLIACRPIEDEEPSETDGCLMWSPIMMTEQPYTSMSLTLLLATFTFCCCLDS